MLFKYLITAFIFLSGNQSFLSIKMNAHALHLSNFEIREDAGQSMMNLRLRVFQDDCRDAIKNARLSAVPIANETFLTDQQAAIETYFQTYLQLKFDDNPAIFTLIQSNAEADIYEFTFSFSPPGQWKKMAIRADYFMELFDDQSNIGMVVFKEIKQFFRFTAGQKNVEFVY